MKRSKLILAVIAVIIIVFLIFTAVSPILIIAEDTTEGDPGIDMAATWSLTGGFTWIYPGDSHNAQGQTLHNIHLNDPDNPYGAAKEIMEYTYNISPHIIISVNNQAAEDIFGTGLVDNIRSYDWGQGYDRGDSVSYAMNDGGMNVFAIPLNILTGNIRFIFV